MSNLASVIMGFIQSVNGSDTTGSAQSIAQLLEKYTAAQPPSSGSTSTTSTTTSYISGTLSFGVGDKGESTVTWTKDPKVKLVSKGKELLFAGKYGAACEWFGKELEGQTKLTDTQKIECLVGRCLSHALLGRLEVAMSDLHSALSVCDNTPIGHYRRALIYSETGGGVEAFRSFERCIAAADPKSVMSFQLNFQNDLANRTVFLWTPREGDTYENLPRLLNTTLPALNLLPSTPEELETAHAEILKHFRSLRAIKHPQTPLFLVDLLNLSVSNLNASRFAQGLELVEEAKLVVDEWSPASMEYFAFLICIYKHYSMVGLGRRENLYESALECFDRLWSVCGGLANPADLSSIVPFFAIVLDSLVCPRGAARAIECIERMESTFLKSAMASDTRLLHVSILFSLKRARAHMILRDFGAGFRQLRTVLQSFKGLSYVEAVLALSKANFHREALEATELMLFVLTYFPTELKPKTLSLLVDWIEKLSALFAVVDATSLYFQLLTFVFLCKNLTRISQNKAMLKRLPQSFWTSKNLGVKYFLNIKKLCVAKPDSFVEFLNRCCTDESFVNSPTWEIWRPSCWSSLEVEFGLAERPEHPLPAPEHATLCARQTAEQKSTVKALKKAMATAIMSSSPAGGSGSGDGSSGAAQLPPPPPSSQGSMSRSSNQTSLPSTATSQSQQQDQSADRKRVSFNEKVSAQSSSQASAPPPEPQTPAPTQTATTTPSQSVSPPSAEDSPNEPPPDLNECFTGGASQTPDGESEKQEGKTEEEEEEEEGCSAEGWVTVEDGEGIGEECCEEDGDQEEEGEEAGVYTYEEEEGEGHEEYFVDLHNRMLEQQRDELGAAYQARLDSIKEQHQARVASLKREMKQRLDQAYKDLKTQVAEAQLAARLEAQKELAQAQAKIAKLQAERDSALQRIKESATATTTTTTTTASANKQHDAAPAVSDRQIESLRKSIGDLTEQVRDLLSDNKRQRSEHEAELRKVRANAESDKANAVKEADKRIAELEDKLSKSNERTQEEVQRVQAEMRKEADAAVLRRDDAFAKAQLEWMMHLTRLQHEKETAVSEARMLSGETSELVRLSVPQLRDLKTKLSRSISQVHNVKREKKRETEKQNEEMNLCSSCHGEQREILLLPCKHVSLCQVCAPVTSRCPLCRTFIESKTKVIL